MRTEAFARHTARRRQPDPGRASHQRGAAALIVTMMLFFGMVLTALFVNRNLVFEQRTSANQYRSTQAFEAAEAGLEWALAQLNGNQPIGADCQPSTDPAATSFRQRYLSYQPTAATFSATTWASGGVATPLHPACVRGSAGWTCNCPTQATALNPPAGSGSLPAFNLQFFAGPKAGLVRVVSTGCSHGGPPCLAGAASNIDASARVEVTLGLVPGLRTPPVAVLTARGSVDAGAAALGVHNPDPATGVTIDAGAGINAPQVRLTAPAGAPAAASVVENDAALAGLAPDRLFASYLGLAKADWKNQPAAYRLACSGDCTDALQTAAASSAISPLVWVDGNADLQGPLVLGTPQRPVALVVTGNLTVSGAVEIRGLLYAGSIVWNATSTGGALLRGALISEGSYGGNGTPELFYDADVLAALRGNSGSFARVSGSWRDF